MIARPGGTSWAVRLSVARRGGWRAWLTASGEFERDLAGQESDSVLTPHVEAENRRRHRPLAGTMYLACTSDLLPMHTRYIHARFGYATPPGNAPAEAYTATRAQMRVPGSHGPPTEPGIELSLGLSMAAVTRCPAAAGWSW
jgi:hypothetical protein